MNKKNNVNNNLVVFLLIVIICLLLCGLGVMYQKVKNLDVSSQNNSSVDVNNSNNNVDILEKEVSIESDEVKNAMESYNKLYISDENLYKSSLYDINHISDYDLVASALNNIEQTYFVSACDDTTQRQEVTLEYINRRLEQYILNKKLSIQNIKSLNNEVSYPIADYEVNNIGIILNGDNLQLVGPCGGEFYFDDFVTKKIIKATIKEDNLYVYEKHAFVEYDTSDENFDLNYYKDYSKNNILEKKVNNTKEPNWDLYNTYKYTFKIKNNKFYFQRLELAN